MFDQCVEVDVFMNAMVLVDFKEPMIYMPSRSLLNQSTDGCKEITDL